MTVAQLRCRSGGQVFKKDRQRCSDGRCPKLYTVALHCSANRGMEGQRTPSVPYCFRQQVLQTRDLPNRASSSISTKRDIFKLNQNGIIVNLDVVLIFIYSHSILDPKIPNF